MNTIRSNTSPREHLFSNSASYNRARHQFVPKPSTQLTTQRPLAARRAKKCRRCSCNLQFVRDDSGATAIEYGLIAAGIAVAIIAVILSVGSDLNTTFQEVSDNLK